MENEGITRMPMIGDTAPAFRSMTTKGKVNFPEDYKGKWVIFFSHPADFTPVCTTEFIALSKRSGEFKEINTELLGLSIDSLHSHLAWAKNVETINWKGQGQVAISFPIVADISMKVAKLYGMLQTVAKTQTVRAVFIIDPDSIIRAILYYPMSTGRNIDELKRVILSLQKHDAENISTPADWNPGDDVLMGSPLTLEDARERIKDKKDNIIAYEWYLTAIKDKEGEDNRASDIRISSDKIWIEDEKGNTIAYVEFPEYEEGKVEITHTFVNPAYRGKGLADKVTEGLAKELLNKGKKAALLCSYAIKWFDKNRQYEEVLLDPEGEYRKASELAGDACGIKRKS
ncbi:MAG: peroxiredoxin [Lachnospiraceae bacterium]|nr:peroxiredoxin [Lachnospiraceae bacterium]